MLNLVEGEEDKRGRSFTFLSLFPSRQFHLCSKIISGIVRGIIIQVSPIQNRISRQLILIFLLLLLLTLLCCGI